VKYARLTTGRAGRRRRGARGQALVEFALIVPLFLLIFFGTIEFALILASIGGYDFGARDGARTGAFIGKSDMTVDTQVINTIKSHVQGLAMAHVVEIDIFRATSEGGCLTAPTGSPSAVPIDDPNCIRDQFDQNFNRVSNTWPVNARDDSLANADFLGVRIKYQYNWLTAFFSSSGVPLILSSVSVQRIEPLESSHWPAVSERNAMEPWSPLVLLARTPPPAWWQPTSWGGGV
jgi:hypothetical protein